MNDPKNFSKDINDALVFETREEAEAYMREHGIEGVEVMAVAEGSVTGDVKRIQ
jgi:hypothetical protein